MKKKGEKPPNIKMLGEKWLIHQKKAKMEVFISKSIESFMYRMRKKTMTTPNKENVIERAFAIHAKRNHKVSNITPTESELKEDGTYEEAKNELMRNSDEYLAYLEKEAASLGYRLDRQKSCELERQVVPDEFEVDLEEALRTGIFISGTSQSGKSNLAFIIADLLMKEDVIVFVVDPSQAWNKSSVPTRLRIDFPKRGQKNITWKHIPTVFDVSRLTVLQQKEFVENFCKAIFEDRVNSSHRPQIFIFFEEAHLYFPEGCMRAKRYQEALRIITVGRNFNIRFGLITQWCALIDKTVIKFPRQRYFGYTDEKNDKEYLRNFIGSRVDELETLQVGEFMYDVGKKTKKVQVPLFKLVKA